MPVLPGIADVDGRLPVLGVVGGGQLGRMFVHAAQQAGFETAVLEPDAAGPAMRVSQHRLQAGYTDESALDALSRL